MKSIDTHQLPHAQDPTVLVHREIVEGPFWQRVPAYARLDEHAFLDYRWQVRNTITKPRQLLDFLAELSDDNFVKDVRDGMLHASMAIRITPYLLSLVDWDDPYADPLVRQFIPLASRQRPDHPRVVLDSLAEQKDSPVPGITHRYPDKVLFLTLDTCPVYCRFCTRSYAVGTDTESTKKVNFKPKLDHWIQAFEYIGSHPELEDVVISGGDLYNLTGDHIRLIGERLLDIPQVRRIRLATKGLAVAPQKMLTDHAWIDAIIYLVELGRKRNKEVCIHTHFNHPNEITWITREVLNGFQQRGVTIRNQCVLLRGVNDDVEVMVTLVRRLGYFHCHSYYVYVHDLVPKVEDLRTSLHTAIKLEKHVRGMTAGFNTPTFVVDTPGGGGKRDAHSFEYYDRTTGVSVFMSPGVCPDALFLYFDPIHLLPTEGRLRWANPKQHEPMINEALQGARAAIAENR